MSAMHLHICEPLENARTKAADRRMSRSVKWQDTRVMVCAPVGPVGPVLPAMKKMIISTTSMPMLTNLGISTKFLSTTTRNRDY